MELLSDLLLEDTYSAAIQFNLDPEFIQMLMLEIRRRQLDEQSNVRIA